MAMHGSPSDDYRGLSDDVGLADQVGCVAEDVLVVGSTHCPFVRRVDDRLLVVNAGSVGRSPVRSALLERTAHAVLLVPCADGRVRALTRDVPIVNEIATAATVRRAG
jgi:predicted phosphodiesterase